MSQTEVQLIKDSTIVNADISNSAAIDVSKVTGAMPLAGGSFTNDVTFTGDSANIVFDKSDSALEFADNAKALFGTGNDLKIDHDGSNSFISESGTGNLVISTTSGSIRIEKNTGEPMIHANVDGAVELYHDNSKKFETTSGGVTVTGNASFADNGELLLGNSNDLIIRHTGSAHQILGGASGAMHIACDEIQLNNGNNNEFMIKANADGAVELYHNNVKKIETTANGIEVIGTITDDGTTHDGDVLFTGASANVLFDKSDSALEFADDAKAIFGSDSDLHIFHDGSNSIILEQGTGNLAIQSSGAEIQLSKGGSFEHMVRAIVDGAVELYHNNSKKLETTSGGAHITGTLSVDAIDMTDNEKILLGNSDDLQIFHDATNSHITNSTGNLDVASGSNINLKVATSENSIVCTANGAVELYHNNSKKLETRSDGLQVDGTVRLPADNSKLLLGAGLDLEIYHDGSHSRIVNGTDGGTLRLQTAGSEEGIVIRQNGAVELYHDNAKALETINLSATRGVKIGQSINIYRSDFGNGNIQNTAGDLYIEAKTGETAALFKADGAVELYFDTSKKFETTSTGISVTGKATFADGNSSGVFLGNSEDLRIFHNGSHSYVENVTGNLNLTSTAAVVIKTNNTEDSVVCNANGSVDLYHNNTKMIETTSTGTSIPDGKFAKFGNSDDMSMGHNTFNYITYSNASLQITGDSTNDILLRPRSNETSAVFEPNEAVKLYYDNSKKFETLSDGVNVTGTLKVNGSAFSGGIANLVEDTSPQLGGDLESNGNDILMADSDRIKLGNSADFQLLHNGSNSFITNSTGFLDIQADAMRILSTGSETLAKFTANGSVNLYHDNSQKFQTDANGINISGVISGASTISTSNGNDAAGTFNRSGSAGTLVELRKDGSNKGTITVGDSAVSYNTTASDKTLKKNFESWNENVLNLFKNINPQKFNFIDQQDTDVKTKGYIAQDLVDSFPEAYPKGDDDKYMFNPSGMVVYLMKAIQELEAEVAALKAA